MVKASRAMPLEQTLDPSNGARRDEVIGLRAISMARRNRRSRCEKPDTARTQDQPLRIVSVSAIRRHSPVAPSERIGHVVRHFALEPHDRPVLVVPPTDIPIQRGQITLIVGPSGSGKSSLLDAFERNHQACLNVGRMRFPCDAAIIDFVAASGSFVDAATILTRCGLGEPRLWIRHFTELSAGEQMRARLARAVALAARAGGNTVLLCDEFASLLHKRVAQSIAHNLHKLTKRQGLCCVLAMHDEAHAADLQPQTIVRLEGGGRIHVERRAVPKNAPFRLRRNMRIVAGRKKDYQTFAAMHYRAADELGFVDKVFVLRAGRDDEPLGIVVYAHSPIALSLRNLATNGLFTGRPNLLNQQMRIVRRLVIHPDVRGCGLGHFLVRRTLPLVGTRYVECLASMGELNPVFERAGMRRIGECALPKRCGRAVAALREFDIDPAHREFVIHVARDSRVREIVTNMVHRWYAAISGEGSRRAARQSPEFLAQAFRGLITSRPVYYLWERGAKRNRQ